MAKTAPVLVSYRFRDPIDLPRRMIRFGKITPRAVRSVEAIVSLLTDRIDDAVFAAAPRLKIVANVAVGVDNIDLESARRRRIWVTHTPDVLTDATADLTWALILAVARRIVEADRWTRTGHFAGWGFDLLRGMELSGKTLGVVGSGRIGKAVAARAKGFGLRVLFAGRSRKDRDRVLRTSDIVTIHCPLTPETHHLIGRRELAMMKPTTLLINTARGPIVDERALVEALRRKRLAGAGLDVYEEEPRIHPGLPRLPNVVLLPHIGSSTQDARRKMVAMAFHGVSEALSGRIPPHRVVR